MDEWIDLRTAVTSRIMAPIEGVLDRSSTKHLSSLIMTSDRKMSE